MQLKGHFKVIQGSNFGLGFSFASGKAEIDAQPIRDGIYVIRTTTSSTSTLRVGSRCYLPGSLRWNGTSVP